MLAVTHQSREERSIIEALLDAIEDLLSGCSPPEPGSADPVVLVDIRDLHALEDAYEAFVDTLADAGSAR